MMVGNICRDSWGMQFKEVDTGSFYTLEAINACQNVELINAECDIWDLWVDGEFVDQYDGLETAIKNAECKVAFRMKLGEVVE